MHPRLLAALAAVLAAPVLAAEPAVEAAVTSPRPTMDVAVGFRGFTRSFGLDSGATSLPRYEGTGAGVAVEAAAFPFATVSPGFWGNLGLVGEGHLSLGLSASRQGHLFPASATTLRGAVTLRIPFGASELSLLAGVGYQGFQLATTSTDGLGTLAQADPGFLGPRGGVGYRLQLGSRVGLKARVGVLYTVSRGQLDALASKASAFGLDAGLQLSVALTRGVELRATGDWSRVFLTLGAAPATEQQFGGGLAVAFTL